MALAEIPPHRMTPLEQLIRAEIAHDGPMPLDRYMGLCLGHPQHGYYMTRDPLGSAGDFTTSPEISQVFGELVGVWAAQVWNLLGKPGAVALLELGPGRGTLMQDALRATARVDGFHAALGVHLLETSPALRKLQQSAITLKQPVWHETLAAPPQCPTIVIANEFFDAIPIRQFELRDNELCERCITVAGQNLSWGLLPTGQKPTTASSNGIYETSPARTGLARSLGGHISQYGGAALIIDYGHRKSANGDTLQAMKNHAYCSVLDTPGEADITSHVDFEQLGRAFADAGASVLPVLTQGEFLNRMGLSLRTEALARNRTPEEKESLTVASHRLADPGKMGELFKVLCATSARLPPPYPFGDP